MVFPGVLVIFSFYVQNVVQIFSRRKSPVPKCAEPCVTSVVVVVDVDGNDLTRLTSFVLYFSNNFLGSNVIAMVGFMTEPDFLLPFSSQFFANFSLFSKDVNLLFPPES